MVQEYINNSNVTAVDLLSRFIGRYMANTQDSDRPSHENVTDLQEAVDRISIASTRMGMRINASKTETQFLGKGALTYRWMDSVYSRWKDSYTSAGLSVRRKALKQMFRGAQEESFTH